MSGGGLEVRVRCILAIVLAASAATHASQTASLDRQAVVQFVRDLHDKISRDDRQAVAARVRYPLTVFAGGVRIPIADAAAFVTSYDIVLTPALKALVASAAASAGSPGGALTTTGEFATIGADAVRIEHINGALTITRITVPLGAAAAPAPDTRAGRGGRVHDETPQRLYLGVGQLRRAGALAAGARDIYVVSAAKNQLLDLRITGVTGRAIVARLTNVRTGKAVDQRAHEGVRTWTGRLPEEGEYRIDVVRLDTGRDPRLSYVLTVVKQ
jgi:hypothetical protein